jgi:hypothetical protein
MKHKRTVIDTFPRVKSFIKSEAAKMGISIREMTRSLCLQWMASAKDRLPLSMEEELKAFSVDDDEPYDDGGKHA